MIDIIPLSVCAASTLTWLTLVFMPVRWRMSERWEVVDSSHAHISKWPSLSVIVPARNESASLPLTLPSWLNQDYAESEIILIDDESSDGTEECANDIAARSDRKIQVLKGSPPPPGWTGKLWALQQGIIASSGEWLLFTDADIRHCPNLWQTILFLAPVAGVCMFIAGAVSLTTAILSSLTLLVMSVTYIPLPRFFGLGIYRAITLPLVGTLYAAMTVSSAVNHLSGRYEWRGIREKD